MFLLQHACNLRGRSRLESWYFEVNEHTVKKKQNKTKKPQELTLMCTSFLSPAHRSLKNCMLRQCNKPSKTRRVRGCTFLQQCRHHCWTSARATATEQTLLVSQKSVWAACSAAALCSLMFSPTTALKQHPQPCQKRWADTILSHMPKTTTSCLLCPIDAVLFILFP